MLGQLLGELEAEDLRVLVGLKQRMSTLAMHHGRVQPGQIIPVQQADQELAARLGQPQDTDSWASKANFAWEAPISPSFASSALPELMMAASSV